MSLARRHTPQPRNLEQTEARNGFSTRGSHKDGSLVWWGVGQGVQGHRCQNCSDENQLVLTVSCPEDDGLGLGWGVKLRLSSCRVRTVVVVVVNLHKDSLSRRVGRQA